MNWEILNLRQGYIHTLISLKQLGHNVESRIDAALDKFETELEAYAEKAKAEVHTVADKFDSYVGKALKYAGDTVSPPVTPPAQAADAYAAQQEAASTAESEAPSLGNDLNQQA